jgi:hypothetical protein
LSEESRLPPEGEKVYTESDLAVLEMIQRVQGGGRLFYIIAGFSVVNSVLNILKVKLWFVGALGVTRLLDLTALDMPSGGTFALWLFNVSLPGGLFACGYYARKFSRAAYWVGFVFYALDALLCLVNQTWIDLAFHAWFLYSLYGGLQAVNVLHRMQQEASSAPE